jgi:hypothetical protein
MLLLPSFVYLLFSYKIKIYYKQKYFSHFFFSFPDLL